MSKKLSDKAIEFCREYSRNGFNWTNAYQTVYWQQDKKMAWIWACNLLKDQRVKDELNSIEWDFRNIGFAEWLDKLEMVKVLKWMTQAIRKVVVKDENGKMVTEIQPDWTTRFNWVMWFAKLTWDLVDKRKVETTPLDWEEETDVDLSKLSWDELRAAREKILKNMTTV